MGQYKLRVWGWEFDGSAHKFLTPSIMILSVILVQ